ncbi:hypothetical protein [Catenovulum maritimum]|uniref:RhsPI domain-containing protein n=1 Tax=Catenovulum maritimum TaxID=1513271 RepID=A0A0J8GQS9_9ALTE|nr:hypothetical protein [Catenovulum maritimum]KMT65160.1 hypothetical protein XM47_10510 [Catenovulum maritimum]
MNNVSDIEKLIEDIWKEPIFSRITTKKLDTSFYSELSKQIPDKFIVIEEVFLRDELENIWESYQAHLSEYEIFPFLGTLGEAVICIGYGEINRGKVYYFDFDFGCFELEGDRLEDFFSKLNLSVPKV